MDSEILRKYDGFIVQCVNTHMLKKGIEPWFLPDYEDRCQEARLAFWTAWKDKGVKAIPEYAQKRISGALDNYYVLTRPITIPRNKFYRTRERETIVSLNEAMRMPEKTNCIQDSLDMLYAHECASKCGKAAPMLSLYLRGYPVTDCLRTYPGGSERNDRRDFDKALSRFKNIYMSASKGGIH